MAEEIESPASEPENAAAGVNRRARNRQIPVRRPRPAAPAKPTTARAVARPASAKRAGRVSKPLRSLVILSMVGGLVATVALPAFAASTGTVDETKTVQQMAADDAQTFVAASDATAVELSRGSYAATTPEEIDKKKAEAAAAERAREAQKRASAASAGSTKIGTNIALTSPGSGEVRWPLLNFTKGRGIGHSGNHKGVDLIAAGGEPIYAAAAGTVKVSSESYYGYGVAVTIDHVIGGQNVSTVYGHMTYGTRQVVAGQHVEAGQLIGLVGCTGQCTGNHLHFEVLINGGLVDPWAWLQANAG